MRSKILRTEQIPEWRESIARANGTVAVVMGSFSILQPGNHTAIDLAKKNASYVLVLIEPEGTRFGTEQKHDSPSKRMELIASLRDVSAVCETPSNVNDLEKLSPYIMIDCLAQPESGQLRRTVRSAAEDVVDIPIVPGCFTKDILNAVRAGQTPIAISGAMEPPTHTDPDKTIASWHYGKKTLVTVNGCFDILHIGHTRMLAKARGMGDELIVLVNDDASVRAYKGAGRPVFPIRFRQKTMEALSSVSMACPFSGDNPLSLLAKIKPDIHVKGGSFEQDRVSAEKDIVAAWGGRLEFCQMVEGHSTTRIIQS